MEFITLAIIFFASIVAGMYGALVGGPALVTIPLLIFLGISPIVSIATNRVGLIGVATAGWYKFHIKGKIDYRIGWILAIPAIIGSYFGANIVLNIEDIILKRIIAIFTLALLAFLIFKPSLGLKTQNKKLFTRHYLIGGVLSFFVGVYGGFYGAGMGTFMIYILILLFGQSFIQGAATNKISLVLLGLMAATVFIFNKVVLFEFAAVIFIGSFIGGYISSHYAEKIGNRYIKWLFVLVVGIMALKLLF
tara:strand:- start:3707 stop:4453 length:747 start_codon:yes stop_codon:yes gene_type:complete